MRALLALLLFAAPAMAHDAIPTAAKPNGWTYPTICCSGYDCREVDGPDEKTGKTVQILETPKGYKISTTGEEIPHGDPKIKQISQDGKYHWCSAAGKDDSKTICLIVPPPAT